MLLLVAYFFPGIIIAGQIWNANYQRDNPFRHETHLELLFHKLPRLICQQNRLPDLCLLNALFGVGPMGDLIDVIADC